MTIKFPAKYVQDAGALHSVGFYAAEYGKSALIIVDPFDNEKLTRIVSESLAKAGVSASAKVFSGTPNVSELIRTASEGANHDVIIGVGSGKIMDAAKATAHYADKPVIICPTVASSDAPCSGIAVVTDNSTRTVKYLQLKSNPQVVIVDTAIVASAPVKLTAVGMADSLATYYEARAYMKKNGENEAYHSVLTGAIVDLCRDNIYKYGKEAIEDIKNDELTDAVEAVIEANILLSGLGFENTGLAAAHALEKAFTAYKSKALHGEKVAVGLLIQLTLEKAESDRNEVAQFFKSVGIPTSLSEIGIDINNKETLKGIAKFAMSVKSMSNMPVDVTESTLINAITEANDFSKSL